MINYFVKNGKVVYREEAVLGITDLAILRGYGVFDFFLVKNRIPLFFEDHLNRFFHSATSLNLKIPFSKTEIKEQVQYLVQLNNQEAAAIKLLLTGGYSNDGYTVDSPNFFILQTPLPKYLSTDYSEGLKLSLYSHERSFPLVKSTNYMVGVFAEAQAMANGTRGALYHKNGFIKETPFSNFFIVNKDDEIVTPNEGVLLGITRKHVIEASEKHYHLEERALSLDELKTAKEAFVTSSSKKVVPIIQVDETIIGNGKPGRVSKHLFELISKKEKEYLITNNQFSYEKECSSKKFA